MVSTRGVLRRSPRLLAQQKAAVKAAVLINSTAPKKRRPSRRKKAPPLSGRRKGAPKSTTQGSTKPTPPEKKQKRTGLKGTVNTSAPLGVIDPASGLTGEIVILDGDAADVMLVLVDPAKNSDKFFVLQCIEQDNASCFTVYTRWGRTGTSGQALQQDFSQLAEARKAFTEKFKQKTGLTWSNRSEPSKSGKYRLIVQDFEQKRGGWSNGKWQYYVDDGVDGKRPGWYDYTQDGSRAVEMLFHQNAQNPDLTQRNVTSGHFTYNVDLLNMTQTNVTHNAHTTRPIRRTAIDGAPPVRGPPVVAPAVATITPPAATAAATATTTPPRRSGRSAPVVSPSPTKK